MGKNYTTYTESNIYIVTEKQKKISFLHVNASIDSRGLQESS